MKTLEPNSPPPNATPPRIRPFRFDRRVADAMVRAVIEGRKTQHRVAASPPAKAVFLPDDHWKNDPDEPGAAYLDDESGRLRIVCPLGRVGDRLWLQETWQYADWTEDGEPFVRYAAGGGDRLCRPSDDWADRVWDTWAGLSDPANRAIDGRSADRRWRPAHHMPRWASRVTLEITSVRVERGGKISPGDARAEGIEEYALQHGLADDWDAAFVRLWDEINAGHGNGWASRPWLWAIDFKVVGGAS